MTPNSYERTLDELSNTFFRLSLRLGAELVQGRVLKPRTIPSLLAPARNRVKRNRAKC